MNNGNTVAETDTSNNCGPWAYVTVSGAGLPDLTVSAGPTPTTATHGVATTIQGVVQNIGNATASGSWQNFFQFLDVNHNCTQPNFCAAIYTNTGPLAAGASVGTSGTYTFPVAGTYTTRLCVNNGNTVAESSTANNCGPWSYVTVN